MKSWAIIQQIMIFGKDTSTLYLADCLENKQTCFFKRFTVILKQKGIDYKFIPHTKDIWAVDYMPIQISTDKFIQFVYNPDYLRFKKPEKLFPEMDRICEDLEIKQIKTTLYWMAAML